MRKRLTETLRMIEALKEGDLTVRQLYKIVYDHEAKDNVDDDAYNRIRVLIWQVNHDLLDCVPKGTRIVSIDLGTKRRSEPRVKYHLIRSNE